MSAEGHIQPLELGEKKKEQVTGTASSHTPREKGNSVLFFVIIALVFFIPIFFVPSPIIEQVFAKSTFIVSLTVLMCVLWLGGILKTGKFEIVQSPILFSLLGIPAVGFVSALLAQHIKGSLVGSGFAQGSVVTLGVLAALAFLTALFLNTRPKIFYFYLAFIGSFTLVALYTLVRLFAPVGFLSFGVFPQVTNTLLGGWYDLSVFFGVGAILSLIALELVKFSRALRWVLMAGLIVSICFLITANYTPVWFALSGFSLLFFVYQLVFVRSFAKGDDVKKKDGSHTALVPVATLVVLIISIFFSLTAQRVTESINERLGINYFEVHPTWSATFSVAREALKENPVLGAGPNTFVNSWMKYKPLEVNEDRFFWGVEFPAGRGLVPSLMVETGFVGVAAWLLFFFSFLYIGFRVILSPPKEIFSYYLILSSFMAGLFLWVMAIIFTPSFVNFALAFLFTGAFVASLSVEGMAKRTVVSIADNPRLGFGAVMGTIFLLLVTLSVGYVTFQKFFAYSSVSEGVIMVQNGNIEGGKALIERGVRMDPTNARFLLILSEVAMAEINILFQTSDPNSESTVQEFQVLYAEAITNAQQAITVGGKNYRNYIALGRLYEAVAPLGITNAYEAAKQSYLTASEYNPLGPAIPLLLARLERTVGNYDSAREYIGQALNLKGNYAEAIFLLSQIEAESGNIERAIESTQAVATLVPNDASIFFQLGLLKYNKGDYRGASDALARAVAINPEYANARYFLGLSYYEIDTTSNARAIEQFEYIQRTNPENEEVVSILTNLRANRAPFANSAPALLPPEERETLPIPEE